LEYNETVFIDFKKAYDSVRREVNIVLYSIYTEFGEPMKLVSLIKMCLNETYIKSVLVNICLIIFLFKMV
jgi:hypothetical protein